MSEQPNNPQLLSTETRLVAVHIAVTDGQRAREFVTQTIWSCCKRKTQQLT
jgi:hypothetical protein